MSVKMKKKNVLVLYYSQSGQLERLVESVTSPLLEDSQIEITLEQISPTEQFDFPWSFFNFFDAFPECVYMDAPPINQPSAEQSKYDLIILAYQVWFLSPSLPTTGLLDSDFAKNVFKDTPVITLIGCRNMWLMAQEKVKNKLNDLKARHIDNVVLIDRGGSLINFITVTRWLLTGKKDKLFGVFPEPGISDKDIKDASRFGTVIKKALHEIGDNPISESILAGYKAVTVEEELIFSEKTGYRMFRVWGKILRKVAPRKSSKRYPFIIAFAVYLTLAIILIVPISILIRKILSPFTKEKIAKEKKYYEAPSGGDDFNLINNDG